MNSPFEICRSALNCWKHFANPKPQISKSRMMGICGSTRSKTKFRGSVNLEPPGSLQCGKRLCTASMMNTGPVLLCFNSMCVHACICPCHSRYYRFHSSLTMAQVMGDMTLLSELMKQQHVGAASSSSQV